MVGNRTLKKRQLRAVMMIMLVATVPIARIVAHSPFTRRSAPEYSSQGPPSTSGGSTGLSPEHFKTLNSCKAPHA